MKKSDYKVYFDKKRGRLKTAYILLDGKRYYASTFKSEPLCFTWSTETNKKTGALLSFEQLQSEIKRLNNHYIFYWGDEKVGRIDYSSF